VNKPTMHEVASDEERRSDHECMCFF